MNSIILMILISFIVHIDGNRLLKTIQLNPCDKWENCQSYTSDGCNICECPKDGISSLCPISTCPPEEQTEAECKICVDGYMLDPFSKECHSCDMIQCDIPQCKPGQILVTKTGQCCPGCQERDCSNILCDIPECISDEVLTTLPGDCCPSCQSVGCGINNCIRYNDGCNTCFCDDDEVVFCGLRSCDDDEMTDPVCLECQDGYGLSILTGKCEEIVTQKAVGCDINFCNSYYNGCNECICLDNGLEICTSNECSIDEIEEAYCTGCKSPFRLREQICVLVEPPIDPIECPNGWKLDELTQKCVPTISCKNVLCAHPAICYDTSQGPNCCDPQICESGSCDFEECEEGYECVTDPNNRHDRVCVGSDF